jgi:hypothetical protein
MELSFFDPRDAFFVPSVRCQSLLGKALQEHFTKPEQVASVFSSSPSLRNSSAGANFLTNFNIDEKSAKLFHVVFTPEDSFSLSFSQSISINFFGDERIWKKIFNYMKNLITKNPKYLEASVRSLSIASEFITNEQLHFILSHLKRTTKFSLNLDNNRSVNSAGHSAGLKRIAEILPDLIELRVSSYREVNDSVIQHFVLKLKKLKHLGVEGCAGLNDEGVVAISKSHALTSLSFRACYETPPWFFKPLASMTQLQELNVAGTKFNDEVLVLICSHLLSLRKLDISSCPVSNDGLKNLKSLVNLEFLFMKTVGISDEALDEISCWTSLKELDVSNTYLTEAAFSKIAVALPGLINLNGKKINNRF